MFIWEYVFEFLLFFGDPNGTCLQKQDWQRELFFWIKIFNWELSTFSMKTSIADLTWNSFLLFLNIFPSKNPHFCTAVLDIHMKLLNKCRIIPKEYQINSSYQTVVQFESKLISIRRAKLYYIKTSFTRRVFKFKS